MQNKRVLVVCPEFYEYPSIIVEAIESQGYDADLVFDTLGINYRLAKNVHLDIISRKLWSSFNRSLYEKLRSGSYDILFIIRGEYVRVDTLSRLRAELPCLKVVMYQWDSVRNLDYRKKLAFVDAVFTFDPEDAKNLSIHYLPLFHTGMKKRGEKQKKYDYSFIGSHHGDRLAVIQKLQKIIEEDGRSFSCYLYTPFLVWLRDAVVRGKRLPLKYFRFRKIAHSKVLSIFQDSTVVVDIHSKTQSGFTMRSFEAISSGANLLTTNESMRSLDDKIFVFSRSLGESDVLVVRSAFEVKPKGGLTIGVHICDWVQVIMGSV